MMRGSAGQRNRCKPDGSPGRDNGIDQNYVNHEIALYKCSVADSLYYDAGGAQLINAVDPSNETDQDGIGDVETDPERLPACLLPQHFEGMEMRFQDTKIFKDLRYCLGVEEESGVFYLGFPVSNRMVQYDEYYLLSKEEYEMFLSNPDAALPLLDKCRQRECDERLIQKPGRDRGWAS